MRFPTTALLLLTILAPGRADEDAERHGGPRLFKPIRYRSIGPTAGGRVSRVAGVPGDRLTYYAATAAGGVWKSADGGFTWNPIFDDQPISSIGSIAVAGSDPSVVYVGSGEANIRGNVAAGNGIYKSTDAGKTWKHVWKQEGQIGTMAVHPKNADIAYAAVLGHAFGPNEERGVYRTTDGGKTWKRVLFKDRDTGASDVCLDPNSPDVLFAGLWQTRRLPWEMISGGPGSGLYTSRDGGDTWIQLVALPEKGSPEFGKDAPAGKKYCKGLPPGPWGKIGVAVAPSQSKRVFALIEAEKGGLYRSDDGGHSWEHVNDTRGIRQRAWYYSTLTVDPTNSDVVWFPQVPLLRSLDGGKTIQRIKGPHHSDHHDIWIDPKDPRRIIDANDGGVDISLNGGQSWYAPALAISQFYRIEVDNSAPYRIMGSMQDIGTGGGPSNSLQRNILISDWKPVGGGEAGHVVADPSDPDVVYAGEYGGYISRYDRRTGQAKNVSVYPYNPSGHGGEDLKYRFQWTAPIVVSKHDPKTIYHAANVVFRSTDAGQSWAPLGPDLTRNDKSKMKWSGGPITGDNTGVELYGTVFALSESPKEKGVLWAGSDDGLVHVSRDGGKNWANVTKGMQGLPEWATVWCVEPSPFDAGTAYVVAENHRLDDMKPYLYRTTDYGKTWESLSAPLPQDVYLHVVRCDPKKRGLLYLGTERGVSYSTDDGVTWQPLKLNLPTVAVHDLKVKDNDLVVGTNGRSIWLLEDLTPIRLATDALTKEDAYLFPAMPATRWRYSSRLDEDFITPKLDNPPPGAVIHYFLTNKPKAELKLEVLDGKGETVVRTLTSKEAPREVPTPDEAGEYSEPKSPVIVLPVEPGLHRVVWDLRHEGAKYIKGAKVDWGDPRFGPLVKPGRYVLKLHADGKTYTSEVEVRADARLKGESLQADLAAQEELALRVRDDLSRLTGVVNQLRAVKKQLQLRAELLADDEKAADLLKEGKVLVKKLDALEERLHNPRAKIGYDVLAQRGGARLYSQLAFLFEQLKDADGPPTQGVREMVEEQEKDLQADEKEWRQLLSTDVARLDEAARKVDVPALILPRQDRKDLPRTGGPPK